MQYSTMQWKSQIVWECLIVTNSLDRKVCFYKSLLSVRWLVCSRVSMGHFQHGQFIRLPQAMQNLKHISHSS